MSTRLTVSIRERIANDLLTHKFSAAIGALIADRAAHAHDVYCDIYSKSDRAKMDALPAGWLPESNRIGVQFGSSGRSYVELSFSGAVYGEVNKYRKGTMKHGDRRIISKHVHGCAKVYADDHPLAKAKADLDSKFDDLKTSVSEAAKQVNAALASATTIKRLVEAWPEIEPFARAHEATPPNLPAVPTDRLNKLLDLPVSEAA